jgi:hypothetical protein
VEIIFTDFRKSQRYLKSTLKAILILLTKSKFCQVSPLKIDQNMKNAAKLYASGGSPY